MRLNETRSFGLGKCRPTPEALRRFLSIASILSTVSILFILSLKAQCGTPYTVSTDSQLSV